MSLIFWRFNFVFFCIYFWNDYIRETQELFSFYDKIGYDIELWSPNVPWLTSLF